MNLSEYLIVVCAIRLHYRSRLDFNWRKKTAQNGFAWAGAYRLA